MRSTRKRLWSIFLVVMMLFSFVPTMAWADEAPITITIQGYDLQTIEYPGGGDTTMGYRVPAGVSITLQATANIGNADLSKLQWKAYPYVEDVDPISLGKGSSVTVEPEEGFYSIEAVSTEDDNIYGAIAVRVGNNFPLAYARYEEPRYTVAFDTNAVDGMNVVRGSSIQDKSVQPGYNLEMTEDRFVIKGNAVTQEYKESYRLFAEGYTWEGWYDNEALNGSPVWDMRITENTTLYAKWDGIPAVLTEAPEGMTVEITGYGLGADGMANLPDYARVANITMPQGFSADWINQHDEMAEGMTAFEKLYSMPTQAVLNVNDTIHATEYVLNMKGSDLMALADKGMDLVVKTEFDTFTLAPEALEILGVPATKGDKANAGEGNYSSYDPDVQFVLSKDDNGNTVITAKKRTTANGILAQVRSPKVVPIKVTADEVNVDESIGITYDVPVTMDGAELANMNAMVQMALQKEQPIVYEAVDKFVPNKDAYAIGEDEINMKDRYPNLEDMPTVPPGV